MGLGGEEARKFPQAMSLTSDSNANSHIHESIDDRKSGRAISGSCPVSLRYLYAVLNCLYTVFALHRNQTM